MNEEKQNEEQKERLSHLFLFLELLTDLQKNGIKVYSEIEQTIKEIEKTLF